MLAVGSGTSGRLEVALSAKVVNLMSAEKSRVCEASQPTEVGLAAFARVVTDQQDSYRGKKLLWHGPQVKT